jgi:hypothetical protein
MNARKPCSNGDAARCRSGIARVEFLAQQNESLSRDPMFTAHLQPMIAARRASSDVRVRAGGSGSDWISRATAHRSAHPIFGGRSR